MVTIPETGLAKNRTLRAALASLGQDQERVQRKGLITRHHDWQPFIGQIWDTGPNAEADWADARYWVRECYVTNPRSRNVGDAGQVDTPMELDYMIHHAEAPQAQGRWLTATNLAEVPGLEAIAGDDVAGTHALAKGEYVWCAVSHDINDLVEAQPDNGNIVLGRAIRRWWFAAFSAPLVHKVLTDPAGGEVQVQPANLNGSTTGPVKTWKVLPWP